MLGVSFFIMSIIAVSKYYNIIGGFTKKDIYLETRSTLMIVAANMVEIQTDPATYTGNVDSIFWAL